MKSLSQFTPRVNRLVLVAATFVFSMIGLGYITNPVYALAKPWVTLHSVLANATTRVGFGAFPLGFAIFCLACLISTQRLLIGVRLIATVVTTAIVVRFIQHDGGWSYPGKHAPVHPGGCHASSALRDRHPSGRGPAQNSNLSAPREWQVHERAGREQRASRSPPEFRSFCHLRFAFCLLPFL